MRKPIAETIKRCREAHAKSTPGPYRHKPLSGHVSAPAETCGRMEDPGNDEYYGGALVCESMGHFDAEFLVHAHRAIPRLCNIMETQEAEIEYWKSKQEAVLMTIRERRERMKMTLRDLAKESGVNSGHLSSIENGKSPVTAKTAKKLAPVFGLEKWWMLIEDAPAKRAAS